MGAPKEMRSKKWNKTMPLWDATHTLPKYTHTHKGITQLSQEAWLRQDSYTKMKRWKRLHTRHIYSHNGDNGRTIL